MSSSSLRDINLDIDLTTQQLTVISSGNAIRSYTISTGVAGAGELAGSGCTPRGYHIIRARIGQGALRGSVFVGRRPTGEICSSELFSAYPDRDWILSRILWLSGLEKGFNRCGNVDTMRRYIYIHGCPDEFEMGRPLSHGCIRMTNDDVIELFDEVEAGDRVYIHE